MTTCKQCLIAFAFAAAVAITAPMAMAQSAGSPTLAARSSDAGGIRVVIKPKSVVPGSFWEFDVTMDTHTKPLNDDLTKIAALLDADKHRYEALSWQGDAPGGHHRKGVLRFPAPSKPTGSFEVQIDGLAGTGKRVFQWSAN